MKDFFALLGQPRRPWLEPEQVKQAFVAAASLVHPDRIHEATDKLKREAQRQYTELNEAHLCLRDTRSRLQHLFELEKDRRVPDLQEMPDDLMQLFTTLTQRFTETDCFLREKASATSPMLKVSLFEEGESHREALQKTQALLRQRLFDLEASVRELDQQWTCRVETSHPSHGEVISKLESLYRLISFHERWLQQAQTRMIQLME